MTAPIFAWTLHVIGLVSSVGWFTHYIASVRPSPRRFREDDLDVKLARATTLLLLLVLSVIYIAGTITIIQTGNPGTSAQSLASKAIGAVVLSVMFTFYLIVHYRRKRGGNNGRH